MTDHPVIPNIFANGVGNTADADLVNADFEYLRAWLDSRFGNATSAQLWVANASGVATPRTISGDVTVNNTGVAAIGALKVLTGMLAAGAVTDGKLASPNNSAYRLLHQQTAFLVNDATAGTYILTGSRAAGSPYDLDTTNLTARIVPLVRFVAANVAVAGLTTKLFIASQVACAAADPGITFSVKLYPVTVSGAPDTLTFTLGTAVAGSTSTHTTPASPGIDVANSGDFDIPADGVYALGVGTSGNLANNSAVQVSAQLRVRNV